MSSARWEIWELKVALNLYCKLPFGQYHSNNPEVIRIAGILKRTPSAVAIKLSNFARLDPTHRNCGVRGLSHGSQKDKTIWEQFQNNAEDFVFESEQILKELQAPNLLDKVLNELPSAEGKEQMVLARQRVNQQFFRMMILAGYRYRCSVCLLPEVRLLVASHIVPWAKNVKARMDPRNGIALCSLHDKALDSGLITIGDNYTLMLSPILEKHAKESAIECGFLAYKNTRIHLPDRFLPLLDYLKFHRDHIFLHSIKGSHLAQQE
jgi:putative restriction endonuclease